MPHYLRADMPEPCEPVSAGAVERQPAADSERGHCADRVASSPIGQRNGRETAEVTVKAAVCEILERRPELRGVVAVADMLRGGVLWAA